MPEAEALRWGKAIVSGRGAVAYDGQLARRRPLRPTYALRLVVDRDRTGGLASVRPDDTTRTELAVLLDAAPFPVRQRAYRSCARPGNARAVVMTQQLDVDYLVVGAGATGMAFTDALIDHADVRVALVDRRLATGGHWLDAYPFVQLHQASSFYGVASTLLGGQVQQRGPEAGLHERASGTEICTYYERVLVDRLLPSGKVEWFPGSEHVGGGRVVSRVTGQQFQVPARCRIVDARYLAPDVPSVSPPPFDVVGGARVLPVNDLVGLTEVPREYVVVGSGKTATDAVVWLLGQGIDPGAVRWVRPREPWMLNRAVVQPAPEVFLAMVADTMTAAAAAGSLDDLFLRLEAAGVMLRIDPTVTPTMARAPTLGTWELERLRSVDNVVRRGHVRSVEPGRLHFDDGPLVIPRDALVVHCAASGLQHPPAVPIWTPAAITLQPVRSGFPCFGAALVGYVEATRDDDADKNRLCPPTPYGNSRAEWGRMQVLGARAAQSFGAAPDIRDWANGVALNPARIPPGQAPSAALDDALGRLRANVGPGLARLAQLSGLQAAP